MTLKDAIKIAEEIRGSEVSIVKDCGDRWAFGFRADADRLGSAPAFVFKGDGHCEFFFVGDYIDVLQRGIYVELPN